MLTVCLGGFYFVCVCVVKSSAVVKTHTQIKGGSLGGAGRTPLDGTKAKNMIDSARARCRRGNES